MKGIRILGLALVFSITQTLWAQTSPIPMLENTANQILSTLEKNKSSLKKNPKIIYQAVQQHLVPVVDVSGMSRSVLGREAWKKASTAERSQFSEAFTKLVIRTYSTPLAQYTDEKVKFLPIRGPLDGKFLRVSSIIVRSSGNNIPLNYSLVSNNGQWKIYDLSVEGVSLLQSFRSQFAQVLQNSNIKILIKQMNEKSRITV
jgi:phospholipid transport system substrate-binding protein